MKKFLVSFLIFTTMCGTALALANAVSDRSIAFAADSPAAPAAPAPAEAENPTEPIGILDIVGRKTKLADWTSRFHDLSSVDPGADTITSVLFTAIDFIKYLLGGIALIFMTVSGIKLVTAGSKIDEVSEKEKENIKLILYGLILVIIADELVTKVFFGDYGECIASASNAAECAKTGGNLIKGLYSLALSVLGTLSLFFIVFSGFKLMTAFGKEEEITKHKNHIYMAVTGLLLAAVGEFVVKGIVFPAYGTKGIDVAAAKKLVYNFTNFVSAFIGVAAFLMLFYGGYLYVASFGNEEQTGKAKKIIIGAFVGIAIALAAFGAVTTIIRLT